MVAWQELHIQSNIPLIAITVSLICLAIIGFLEFRKISVRMGEISNEMEKLKSYVGNTGHRVTNEQGMKGEQRATNGPGVTNEQEMADEQEMTDEQGASTIPHPQEEFDHMKQDVDQGDLTGIIMGGIPPHQNMMPGGIASMIMGGSMMPMGIIGDISQQNIYEEEIAQHPLDIENKNRLEEISDEQLSECSLEDVKKEEEDDHFSEEDSQCSESETESDSDSEVDGEEEEEEVNGIEMIQGKGKVEEVKEVKEVTRSLSIKELKNICQSMDLSTSGNKETLVKRINSRK